MEEACIYNKNGHCKFREKCLRKHYSEVCHRLETCNSIKTGEKSVENIIQKGVVGMQVTAHTTTIHSKRKPCECIAKIDILEKIVTELTKKIIDHENKLGDIKTLFKENNEVKEKVNLCEAVVKKMFMNIIKLDTEVHDLKTIIKDIIEEAASNMKPISRKTECKSTHEKSVKEEVKNNNDKQNNDI